MRCHQCLDRANILYEGQIVGTWCPGGISDLECIAAIFALSSLFVTTVIFFVAHKMKGDK